MLNDTFECEGVYKNFFNEYLNSCFLGWDIFIKHKDIGIKVANGTLSNTFAKAQYIVTNQHKWLLSKLKYSL